MNEENKDLTVWIAVSYFNCETFKDATVDSFKPLLLGRIFVKPMTQKFASYQLRPSIFIGY